MVSYVIDRIGDCVIGGRLVEGRVIGGQSHKG